MPRPSPTSQFRHSPVIASIRSRGCGRLPTASPPYCVVARGAGAAGPVLLACCQWDPLGPARRLPSLGVRAWRSAPLLPWRVQCPVHVCTALAAGSGGSGWYLVSCLPRFPLPAPRVPRCVWRAVPSGCCLPTLAGTPFHAVCAFRELGPVALLVIPACPLRVGALALPRRPLHPLLGGVACAPRAVPALGAGRAVPRGLCPSACPAPVPCSFWRAWGGTVRSRFPPTWLRVVGVAVGRPRGGAFHCGEGRLGSGAPPPPTARPLGGLLGSATHVLSARAFGCWGPTLSPWPARPLGAACRGGGGGPSPYLAWGCAPPMGRVRGVPVPGGGLGGGGGAARAPWPPFVRPGGACRAGGRSASFRHSASPGQATKRVSLASFFPWGAWPPIRLRFVLACLQWARSVRRPGALARARLFPAVPVGAGSSFGRGEGGPSPLPRGVGPGAPAACAPVGGVGGGSRRGLPAPPLGGGPRFPTLAPLLLSVHSPPACACGRGSGAAPGWGGTRGGPWTAPPGAPADLNPPSALPEWAVVMGGSWGARPPYCSGAPLCAAPRLGQRAAPARWCGLACRPRPPQEQAAGGAGARVVQVQPHPPPPPRVAVPSGGGGVAPRLRGGGGSLLWPSSWGGGAGGGVGGPPACPLAWSGVGLPSVVTGVPPRGILVPWGLPGGRGRRARFAPNWSVRRGGGRGGASPPWFAPPSSPGRPLKGPLCLRRPGRRRSAVGRQEAGRAGALLGRGAPSPRVQRPLRGGCGGAVSSVCLRSLLALRGRGGGSGGGPLVPWRRPLTAEGGRPGSPGLGGQPSAGGSHSSPAPVYLESDPRAGPCWGPSSPLPSSRGAGVRVGGQRLAGCRAVGSPPRSLSLPSLPREVARDPLSRRIVGGAWVGGPSSPPHFLASAVWAVTCAAACVGAGTVAAAGCAGGSASGRGRCAGPGGASCWRWRP